MRRSALKSCFRGGTAREAGTWCQLRAQQLEIARENTTHSEQTQHRVKPPHGQNFPGRNWQPFALPCVMADAEGGMVIRDHGGQRDVMQDACCDDAAHRGDADAVAALQNPCWPSRTPKKMQTRSLQTNNNPKIHLTISSLCTLLFCCRAAAIAFAPSSPTWLQHCKTHVGPHAPRWKSKREVCK